MSGLNGNPYPTLMDRVIELEGKVHALAVAGNLLADGGRSNQEAGIILCEIISGISNRLEELTKRVDDLELLRGDPS